MVTTSRLARGLRHLLQVDARVRRAFPRATLARIEAAVRASEARHRAELRFVVEGALEPWAILRGLTPRERAVELFSALRVWDTAHNNGVLIYVQVVDRDIEIVADRGLNACVAADEWDAVCRAMEDAFRRRDYARGAEEGIAAVTAILERHFPPVDGDADELPNAPVLL